MRISIESSTNLLTLSYVWNKTGEFDVYKKKGHFSLFLLEAMARSPLPAFVYHGQKHPLQKSKEWYGKFDQDLKTFYSKHRQVILLAGKKVSYKEMKYFPKQLQQLLKSFGPYHPPFDQIVLCPNPFGVPGEGYGPLIGRIAFAIFTPNPKKDQTWLMVHEVGHSLLLPIFQSPKIKSLIKRTEPLMQKWSTKKFRQSYPKWEWMIEEYLIHAIEQHVTGSSIKEKMGWGMNRLPWFVTSWTDFQERRRSQSMLSVADWIEEVLTSLASRMK